GKDIGGDVGWDVVSEWSERLVLVGALDGNAEAPGVKRRAAFGPNDDVQFRLFGGEIAERRNVAGEGHFHLTPAFTAQERDGDIGHSKAPVARSPFGPPDQLLSFLHRFLQAAGVRSDLEDRRLLECRELLLGRLCACARTGNAMQVESPMTAARRVTLMVIP